MRDPPELVATDPGIGERPERAARETRFAIRGELIEAQSAACNSSDRSLSREAVIADNFFRGEVACVVTIREYLSLPKQR